MKLTVEKKLNALKIMTIKNTMQNGGDKSFWCDKVGSETYNMFSL